MSSKEDLAHPSLRCPSCGGRLDSTKHQAVCVAPTLENPEAAKIRLLKLQIRDAEELLQDLRDILSDLSREQARGARARLAAYQERWAPQT